MRKHQAVVTLAVVATTIGLTVASSAGTGGVSVTQTVTNQWATGYQAALAVRNDTGSTLTAWHLEFDLPHRISSLWDATLVSQTGNHVVINAPAWAPDLTTGSTATLGYVAALSGARQDPTNCKINGMACTFTGASTTTSSTSSTTAPSTTTTTAPTGGGVALAYTTTTRWDTGYNGQIDIANRSTSTINGWALTFRLPSSTVTQMWNASYTRATDGTYTISNAAWNGSLTPGQSASFGFGASGTPAVPTNCTFNGTPCTFGAGGSPTSATSTTTVAPSTTTTTAPNGGPAGGGPLFAVAPYADVTLWPTVDLPSIARADGLKTYTLGFIVNGQGSCRATWGTYYNLGDNWMADQISALRSMGGDAAVSFGGAANQELAQACPTVAALAAQYQAVIDQYRLTSIDFDIEGAATADPTSIDRRSKAIAQLQQQARAAGRNLQVSLTLPVLPTGLAADGLNVVRSARDNNVDVGVVNVMAMDYGDWAAANPNGQMGTYAVQAATATRNQLATLYPTRSDAQLWAMVGVTPMIGQNDVGSEVFTTADAQTLTDFARSKHLGRLAMWSVSRDVQCAQGVKTTADSLCSGVLQTPNQFGATFGQFTG